MINNMMAVGDGQIKTFALRGVKNNLPYMHDERPLTLEDTVEFFSLILDTKLGPQEKQDLVPPQKTVHAGPCPSLTLPFLSFLPLFQTDTTQRPFSDRKRRFSFISNLVMRSCTGLRMTLCLGIAALKPEASADARQKWGPLSTAPHCPALSQRRPLVRFAIKG
jgi:hypothetical protein